MSKAILLLIFFSQKFIISGFYMSAPKQMSQREG